MGILPAMAPLHSACWPPTTLSLILKVFNHRPNWGRMRRKASHTTMNAKMLRTKFSPVEHETTNEWMEGKPQSAEEVVEEDYPLVRFRGRNDLPRSGQPMRDVRS